jgi:hypothetical protein
MNNKLKDALSMSKTNLDWYKRDPHYRQDYQSEYNSLSKKIDKFIHMLDYEYKLSIENGKPTNEYLFLNEEIAELTKRLKRSYANLQGETKDTWHTIRGQVLEAYENYPDAYKFLRNQMAIAKVEEIDNFKTYLYRNYLIQKPKNEKRYFAYPNGKMPWYDFDVDLPVEYGYVEAKTLYEIQYSIDQLIMKLFAIKTNLMEI